MIEGDRVKWEGRDGSSITGVITSMRNVGFYMFVTIKDPSGKETEVCANDVGTKSLGMI